ncbi:cytochrome c oxidase subunit 3 [Virgibacillus sp. 179-BFC.A HS]|uniref:Cytochrome c oxidase subunit 3 n=1 Tax=Tigheibacillus jepli TaxID=3035914 RepID=A0ABU5CG01_9BACI|nr:cytochrome c oxidase subunit 3 [Virgibacillus sp. 179-BFC.A HS]MDY0404513.1 cytochrome c oxidase subunit 3 [Virgibacillus sp. 179-BFC.A HS]
MTNNEAALFRDKQIGFFIYLGVEAVMFLTLFATYIIFTPATQGPRPGEIFEAKSLILSSFFLLSSSGTLMLAEKGMKEKKTGKLLVWLGITLLFGLIFLGFEISDFHKYISEGYLTSTSNFLGSFYVLVGLHAAHVMFGSGWMILLLIQQRMNIPTSLFQEKLKIFSYYWHFVDVVWVFIIVIVYLPYMI